MSEASRPNAALSARELEVRAAGRTTLRVDRLDVSQGELVSLIGPNGSGKSTLLRCCLGFVRPHGGQLEVLGQSLTRVRRTALCRLRRRIGYVPQVLAGVTAAPLTVREVVAIGRSGRTGMLRRLAVGDWAAVDQWIQRLGLGPLAQRAYSELSGGEQRKTLIAKAMVQEPELLLLDEPTANLDLYWREQIVATLSELYRQSRLTVVLVCHELDVIPPDCRRLLLLESGRLAASGIPEEVLQPECVARLYGDRLTVASQGGRFSVVPRGDNTS